MAWSWSHTLEAYEYARSQIQDLGRENLEMIYAEWMAAEATDEEGSEPVFNSEKYDTALSRARYLPDDMLADHIWDRASEAATCDNGGFRAWACPWGCHTVPFSREQSADR